jgi:phage baseplate assembly protein W
MLSYLSNKKDMAKYININYPFKDSPKGFFLDLTSDDAAAIKADLMHLILTRKGERLYNPDFGTDLLKFIFEPQDGLTLMGVKTEITSVVKRYLPKLQIDEISVVQSPDSEHAAVVTIKYTITDDVFNTSDIVIINI